jgi:hypothetical protein
VFSVSQAFRYDSKLAFPLRFLIVFVDWLAVALSWLNGWLAG